MEFLWVILILAVVWGALLLLAVLLSLILNSVHNKTIGGILFVLFCILFLPAMLMRWSAGKITEIERTLAPFSYSLRAKSRLIILSLAAYAFAYYQLYKLLFI